MEHAELGVFLRHRREQLRPADVGLIAGGRRRAVGLRRDEVALLADMSTDYYERIEQGRGPRPSPAMLGAIARALRLTLDERDHVYRLAGQAPPPRHRSLGYADAGLMCVLDALAPSVPALISDDLSTVVAQNALNVALLGPIAQADGRRRNFLWRWFADGDLRARYLPDQHERLSREYVADLRVTLGQRPQDDDIRSLVEELSRASAEFREVWERQEVAVRQVTRKVLVHPEVGRLDLECDIVLSPPSGQRLVLFRPQPGSGSGARLEMLAVLGTQTFTAHSSSTGLSSTPWPTPRT
ncbi:MULTISPECIES: helix-turn-helix transcriptional regulator [Pseudofrankia]|uniref:helix-turn-helix transcriptional regulator n=1 Tax=Pseudofrankia TaxID=2994363 RepID=UPI000234B230|nr:MULTISPECIES: helix-turn-helix transcriptional regulator [Pseudofrankia]OHV38439.1 XRE family transcriptional regulator [Pseudofrankia sp. EUN1h]